MVHHPTRDTLQTLRLNGMDQALIEQMTLPAVDSLRCDERLGFLVDRALTQRDSKRLKTRLQQAKLRQAACLEALDSRPPRG